MLYMVPKDACHREMLDLLIIQLHQKIKQIFYCMICSTSPQKQFSAQAIQL